MGEIQIEGFQTCARCGAEKHITDFGIARNERHGRRYSCRECLRQTRNVAADRERNRENYRAAYADPIRREAINTAHRKTRTERYWADPEAGREAARNERRRRRQRDPEKARMWARHRIAQYRAQRYGCDVVEYVDPLVVIERHDGVCGICGLDVDATDFEVDHIVPFSRGGEHSYANTQPSHHACNAHKHNRLPEELAA